MAALGLGAVLLLKSPLMGGSGYYLSHIVQVYPLVYAAWLYAWRKTGWKGVLCSLLGLYPLLLVGTQARYLSEVLILAVTGLILLLLLAAWDWFGVGKRGRWAVVLASVLPAAAGTCFLLSREYIRTRLYYAFYPWEDPLGYGFTGVAVQQALDSARWLGPGAWDHSRPYEMTVPEGGADFLLTTVIHKLGWLPFALLLVAFGVLLVWVLVRCLRQQSVLGKLTVLAVVLPLVMQGIGGAVMNLGVSLCTVSFPLLTTGMGMLVDLALLGFALSAFRQERLPRSDRPQTDRSFEILRISRQKGSLTISWQGEKPKHE